MGSPPRADRSESRKENAGSDRRPTQQKRDRAGEAVPSKYRRRALRRRLCEPSSARKTYGFYNR